MINKNKNSLNPFPILPLRCLLLSTSRPTQSYSWSLHTGERTYTLNMHGTQQTKINTYWGENKLICLSSLDLLYRCLSPLRAGIRYTPLNLNTPVWKHGADAFIRSFRRHYTLSLTRFHNFLWISLVRWSRVSLLLHYLLLIIHKLNTYKSKCDWVQGSLKGR
jgi:hypothetical protein